MTISRFIYLNDVGRSNKQLNLLTEQIFKFIILLKPEDITSYIKVLPYHSPTSAQRPAFAKILDVLFFL